MTKTPDLRNVGYELVYSLECTVCPKGEGDVAIVEISGSAVPDGLECRTCKTCWDVDGEYGESPIIPEYTIEDPNQLKLFELESK